MVVHVSRYPLKSCENLTVVSRPEDALPLLRQSSGEKRMVIHEGTYYGTRLELDARDNGLVIESANDRTPVLSGGVVLDGWEKDPKTGWFRNKVPEIDGRPVDFRLLITIDGRYLKKARYPLEGAFPHKTVFTAAQWHGSAYNGWRRPLLDDELNHFEYYPEHIGADFDAVSAEVQVYHSWSESYTKISRHDRENHTFWLDPVCGYPPGVWKRSYAIYNTIEGMAEDGRWYCDRNTQTIWYRPYPDERAEDFTTIVPVTTRIISLADGCENIAIRDIELTAATTPIVTERYQHPCQRGGTGFGVMEQDAAIIGEDLRNIVVENVHIHHTGGYGVKMKGRNLYVRGCRIHHCGAGGVGISCPNEITPEIQASDTGQWSAVENCHIEWIGLDYYGGVGIFCDSAMLRGNYIANTPYSGILANGDYLVVEQNIVYNPMLKINDGAAIYLHINKGSIVRHNYCVTDQKPRKDDDLIFGLYLDVRTSEFTVCNNVVKGFWKPVLNHNSQPTNTWCDNYFEYDGEMTVYLLHSEDVNMLRNVFKCRNLVVVGNPKAFGKIEKNVVFSESDNILWQERVNHYTNEGTLQDHEIEATGTNVFAKNNVFIKVEPNR